jgi:hypothetical protein
MSVNPTISPKINNSTTNPIRMAIKTRKEYSLFFKTVITPKTKEITCAIIAEDPTIVTRTSDVITFRSSEKTYKNMPVTMK